MAELLARSVRAVIVDEAFDANELDLRILDMLCEQGVSVTLIGDPWQALYEFRGASPLHAEMLLQKHAFHPVPLTESFRFKNAATPDLSERMRVGLPVTVPRQELDGETDVVLAGRWEDMWGLGPEVLPLSFGRPTSEGKALVTLLLNRFTANVFKAQAIFFNDSLRRLGLATDIDLTEDLDDILHTLREAGTKAVVEAEKQLLRAIGESGPAWRRLDLSDYRQDLWYLARRVGSQGPVFVPGMTVHQAKGQEWGAVSSLRRRRTSPSCAPAWIEAVPTTD